jgi:hypothetical protein
MPTCCAMPAALPSQIAGSIRGALQAYLGHANIQNTTRYTALAEGRFKGFWRD